MIIGKRLKKLLMVFFLVIYTFIQVQILPAKSFADTPTPTDTPTATITSDPTSSPTTTTPSATPSDSVTPTAPADNYALTSGTPTSIPTDVPSPTVSVAGDNNGTVSNNIDSGANSGNNSIVATPSATPTDTPSATDSATPTATPTSSLTPTPDPTSQTSSSNSNNSIQTGNATTTTSVTNTTNTNVVNSQVVYQTLNIFVDTVGDLDLSQPFKIAQDVIAQDKNNNNVINVKITGNNYAYVNNSIVSTANSGTNQINGTGGTGNAIISTSNANSEVNLLNQVNFNVVDSVVHDITINIYGKITGNIILPSLMQSTSCTNCGISINNNNTATVTNNVNSQAVSGQNTITALSGNSTITTGNVDSNVNVANLVNTNVINSYIEELFLTDLGLWNGNFLGWDTLAPQTGGQNLALVASGPTTAGSGNDPVDIQTHNNAQVVNNVTSSANSGGNSINGSSGNITTGNAHSVVSIDNFVNDTIFGSLIGIFHINILDGDFTGDIGDPSKFVTPTPTTTPEPSSDATNSSNNNSGGSCNANNAGVSIYASNNTGSYVNPGDTITFFATIKNTGNTDLTNTSLRISLLKDGVDLGDPTFNIGTLGVGKTVKVTAGLKISNTLQPGNYQAKATVSTNTCDSNTNPSASSTTDFVVGGLLNAGTSLIAQAEAAPPAKKAVLGKSINLTNGIACSSCTWWQILLGETVALITYYLLIDPRLKYKRKMWTSLLIPVVTYLIFLILNKSCAISTPWWQLWKWHTNFSSLECKFFWALDAILYTLMAWVTKGYQKFLASRKKVKKK